MKGMTRIEMESSVYVEKAVAAATTSNSNSLDKQQGNIIPEYKTIKKLKLHVFIMGLLEIGLIIAVAVLLKQVFFVPETRNNSLVNQQQQQGNPSSSVCFCNDSRILGLEKKITPATSSHEQLECERFGRFCGRHQG